VAVFVDELQDYVVCLRTWARLLAQARGLGVAFALANQHLDQLPPKLLAGVLAKRADRVVFQPDSGPTLPCWRAASEISARGLSSTCRCTRLFEAGGRRGVTPT